MAERVWRWLCLGLVLGLLPLLLACAVRWYYAERPPAPAEVLGGGDALLVVVTWSATALLDLGTARRGSDALRTFVGVVALAGAVGGAVAYGCLTADSVTGRAQTETQRRFLTTVSLYGLVVSAGASTAAVALTGRDEEDGR